MLLEFGYGNTTQKINVEDNNLMGVLKSNSVNHEHCGVDAVTHAFKNPIGTEPLHKLVNPNMKVAIVTSDISRPLPSWMIMSTLLDELYLGGVKKENVKVVLALGSHRQHTREEMEHLVGKRCMKEVEVVDSNINNCTHLGKTKNGTPCDFDKNVCDADFRICLGNIEFHYFAGYSGGYKALMPGVSTPSAIQANHSLMVSSNAVAGKLDNNPVREDIEEAGKMLGCDFIVNAVLDEHKNIVYCVAGDPVLAHRQGCKYLDKMYRKPINKKAEIVIVSQGGAPKDANLYQTQKALDNAKHAVADGGTIILIGACNEGLGSAKFEEWLTSAETSHSMIEKIRTNFELGGHKAAAIAMILENADISLVSEFEPEFAKSIFFTPYSSAQEAYDDAIKKHGQDANVLAMPFGGSTLPIVKENQ